MEAFMAKHKENLSKQISRKFKREGKGIARGVAREGRKIITGAIKDFSMSSIRFASTVPVREGQATPDHKDEGMQMPT
jgi:hypothetical protein